MKAILFIISLISINFSFAQMYVQPNQISGDTNSCNSTIVIECQNPALEFRIEKLMSPLSPYNIPVFIGDTLTDFCYGTLMSEDRIGWNINRSFIVGAQGFSTLIPQHLKYHFENLNYPSTKLSHDGSITLVFDSIITDYTLYVTPIEALVTLLDDHTARIDSLPYCRLDIEIHNTNYYEDFAYFAVAIGTLDSIIPLTGLDVNVSYHHSNNNCEGWINLQPINTIGSIYHSWNDSVMSTNNRIDLCPGIYSVYSNELIIGYPFYYNGKFDTIILTNDDFTYIDTNLNYIIPQDTSVYTFVDCGFNYNAPIDSMHYVEDTLFNAGGMTIVNFTMTFYQGMNIASVTDSLIMLNDSLIFMDVVIYCSELKSNDFDGRRIKFLRGVDNHGFIQAEDIGFSENSKDILSCFPNPATNELFVNLSNTNELVRLSIIDLQGNILISKNSHLQETAISLDGISSGNYLLIVENDKGSYRHLFTKQ